MKVQSGTYGGTEYVFDSGRTVFVDDGIVGISQHGSLLRGHHLDDFDPGEDGLTADERRDIGEFMIAQWRRWIAEGNPQD